MSLAKLAAKLLLVLCTAAKDDMFWIKQSLKNSPGIESSEHFLCNLQDCAKAAVHDKHKLGGANQNTKMVRAWRGMANDLMQDITCGFWEEDQKVNDAMLRNVLKCRFSQLWHMVKAHMFKMPYFPGGPVATDACPLFFFFFFFFFLGGKDIHYTSAMIATSRVCDVHHKPKRPKLTTHLEWSRPSRY